MKNKSFFYLQYNKIDWKNQEKTKINSFINDYIIQNIISKHGGSGISIFDIGFGIGFFFEMLLAALRGKYKDILIEGCEPSRVNYNYFLKKQKKFSSEAIINTYKKTFQDTKTNAAFDFVTAIYVFPHFLSVDLEDIVRKIYVLLKKGGKFILVLAEEKYLENKLKTEQDLFIEKEIMIYRGRRYKEILHYSDIPKIGKVIDYNREAAYYLDLFKNNGFHLKHKTNLDDNGFVCTLFVFEKI